MSKIIQAILSRKTRHLVIDGTQDGVWSGDAEHGPFAVFDVDSQINIAGPFQLRAQASQVKAAALVANPEVTVCPTCSAKSNGATCCSQCSGAGFIAPVEAFGQGTYDEQLAQFNAAVA